MRVYTLPITLEGDALLKPADEGERQEAEDELLPVEEAVDGVGEDTRKERPADGDDAGRWTERIEHEEGVKIR